MPPRRLPDLPLPRNGYDGRRGRPLTGPEAVRRDQLLEELRACRERELAAQSAVLLAVRDCLEGRATVGQVAEVLATSETALHQWLSRSRRRTLAAV